LNKKGVFIDANLFIYLNCMREEENRRPYEDLYYNILRAHIAFTDLLVLDEVIWISRKKYGVPYGVTLNFIRNAILPYVNILPIDSMIIDSFLEILVKYNLKPSDAIHVAVMLMHNIPMIVSEDDDFDSIVEIKRIWL